MKASSKFVTSKAIVLGAILIILVACGVIYALRSGIERGSMEKTEFDVAALDKAILAVRKPLRDAGCLYIDLTPPQDQIHGDKSCHAFHADGGDLSYSLSIETCSTKLLSSIFNEPGDRCREIVFAGWHADMKLYTTPTDEGIITWNNGSQNWVATAVLDTTDGLANTERLVSQVDEGAPYKAARACRDRGQNWYMPSRDELHVLFKNRAAIGGFNETGSHPDGRYWSSSEGNQYLAWSQRFSEGHVYFDNKNSMLSIRCVRR
ncbi:Lcl C-terminal domain-containing protein [Tropicimonas aquimaris]|uniref:DUF1566 domain-containing protein n=1 Tax=Tropicimonas aquimaris TaxID=914152 RepID=A0ABW3IR29_9RHOB